MGFENLANSAATTVPTVKVLSGSPTGTELATLTGPTSIDAATTKNYTFTALANTTLAASTTYFVVVEGGQDLILIRITGSDNEDTEGKSGWSIEDRSKRRIASELTHDFQFRNDALLIRVNGTVNAPDTVAPTVSITGVPLTSTAPFTATFTFSEPVTGFAVEDIALGNATGSNFTAVSTSVYTALITPTAPGTVTVDVVTGAATDTADNGNTAATQARSSYGLSVSLVGNLATPHTVGWGASGFKQQFTTGPSAGGYTVDSIRVVQHWRVPTPPGTITMEVCPVAPAPGSCVAFQTPQNVLSRWHNLVFTAPAATVLGPSVTYEMRLRTSERRLHLGGTSNYGGHSQDPGAEPGWSIHASSPFNGSVRFAVMGGVAAATSQQVAAPSVTGVAILPELGNGSWDAGETVEAKFTFDEAVTVDTAGGVPAVSLSLGASTQKSAPYLRGSGTTELVFGYTVQTV